MIDDRTLHFAFYPEWLSLLAACTVNICCSLRSEAEAKAEGEDEGAQAKAK